MNKKNIIIFSIIIGVLTSFGMTSCKKWSEQTITKSYFAGNEINGLIIEGPATVLVEESDQSGLNIEINDNLADKLKVTRSSDGIVKVELKNLNIPIGRHLVFNIDAKVNNINVIDASGAASIRGKGIIASERCEIDLSGASTVKDFDMKLKGDLNIKLSGASTVSVKTECNNILSNLSGASDVSIAINKCNNFTSKSSGASKIKTVATQDFTAGNLELDFSGATNAQLGDVRFTNGRVKFSGASEATIWVTGNLIVDLSGASTLYYKGNPTLQSINVDGGSSIHNIK